MEEYNKLEKLINKYLYECTDKKIQIMTSKPDDEIIKMIQKNYKGVDILNGEKINKSCLVILHLQKFDKKLLEFINDHIKYNVIFLAIVPLGFDYNNLIKSVKANSIDADYWRKDGERYKNYIVTIKKD